MAFPYSLQLIALFWVLGWVERRGMQKAILFSDSVCLNGNTMGGGRKSLIRCRAKNLDGHFQTGKAGT